MEPLRTFPLHFVGLGFLALVSSSLAWEEVTGANLTADESFGARQAGLGLKHAGFQNGAEAAINAPAAMNDVNDLTFTSTHAERFGLAQFDCVSLLVPWHAQSTLGFGLARYAVSDIEARTATDLGADAPALFSTADWLVSGSFARRFGGLDVGATLHVLYRRLDQNGLGMRADGMVQYTVSNRYRVGSFLRGLVPSSAQWESGTQEYEPSEISLFASARWEVPYFYGRLQTGWESPGLFQQGGKSTTEVSGKRGIVNPFRTSSLGAEFTFNFGVSLRAGLEELDFGHTASALRFGAGYLWHNMVGIDYAFSSHPDLDNGHRVALRFTPSFPRFQGKSFRPGTIKTVSETQTPSPEEHQNSNPAIPSPDIAPATEELEEE